MPNHQFAHLFAHYACAPDSYDEMLDAGGQPRAHWQALLASLTADAPERMHQRLETVQRQVRENGVTYNVPADADASQRPWDLNVLPLILPHDEWRHIEAAVIQRATLLNEVLADVYGAQRMLAEGLLPPALVHGQAGFLRPCHGMPHTGGVALHFYAVDLARAADGNWAVVADRTQAPAGAGYALENRAILSPTFPDLLRELKVQPLAPFFRTMRDSLMHWGRRCAATGDAPSLLRDGEMPLTVLLTGGPRTESYYEQAYLARNLGLPLVEGGDLTVRAGVVYLKTLAGLHRVHVIMRRVDDASCDPLELQTSMLGVAGLAQAARRGNVVVANGLGSGLLESSALLGYLPALSERLLGEPLKMASRTTWWCGEPAALEAVIANFDRMMIKPAYPHLPQATVFGQDLQGSARAGFIAALRASPNDFIAQKAMRLSQAPVWQDGPAAGLQARAVGLRVFACATPAGYVVMPGGLTRVATGLDGRVLAMQMGGASKDTWVQARAGADVQHGQKSSITSADLVREDTNLSSRVAENLLWFGRHAERCDHTGRLLRVALNYLFNVSFEQRGAEWATVKALCVRFHLLDGATAADAGDAGVESALLLAVVSAEVPGLARQQRQLHRVASQLHERLSSDNWRALNRMVQSPVQPGERPSQSQAMTLLDDAAAALMMLSGFALDGMTRDLGWRFMSIGRRLERLQFQCVTLQRALATSGDGNLDWLLELSDSIVTYRARYRAQAEWLPVLDLLLLDATNPRSVLFQVDGIQSALRRIALTHGACGAELLAPLRDELIALEPGADFNCGNAILSDLLHRLQLASAALSERISVQFFSYTHKGQQRTNAS